MTKEFYSLDDIQKYYNEETNTYIFKEYGMYINLIVFNFDLNVKSNIYAWNIYARNINAYNINAKTIKAKNIKANNIEAWNIYADDKDFNKVKEALEDD